MLLNERVALITGGGSGIGRATAVLFAQNGAKVVVAAINAASGQETVDSIQSAGGEAKFVQGRRRQACCGRCDGPGRHRNVRTPRYRPQQRRHIRDGHCDGVERAGVGLDARCQSEGDVDAGPLRAAADAGPGRGRIRDHRVGPCFARIFHSTTAYQAAKGGLLALTRALAADYAPHIRVNTILPGAVVTGLWDPISEEDREKIAQMCALKRNGSPEEIAQAALFLASDMSSYMTGSHVVVDGGLSSIMMLPDDISL